MLFLKNKYHVVLVAVISHVDQCNGVWLLKAETDQFQAATRSCFYAGFAAQRNFAEVKHYLFLIFLCDI